MDENLGWLTQGTEDPKSNKEIPYFPTQKVNVTELNCRVVKKVGTPLISGLYPFPWKKFCPTQFLEGPTPLLSFLNHIFHVTAPAIKPLIEVLHDSKKVFSAAT